MSSVVMFGVIFFLMSAGCVCCFSCDEVVVVSKKTKVNIIDLEKLSPKDVVDCLSVLGRVKLNKTQADYIWNSVILFYKHLSNIPSELLQSLNWVTIAVKPDDYQNLTLDNIDVIANFGLDYDLSKYQLLAIADSVRKDFGFKKPEDYTFYDLLAFRQILCVFEGSEIRRIHPKPYKEAAVVIGRLKRCNYDVLEGFGKLALEKDAFGSPDNWKRETICILGSVTKHLPDEILKKLKQRLGDDFLTETVKNITKNKDCSWARS